MGLPHAESAELGWDFFHAESAELGWDLFHAESAEWGNTCKNLFQLGMTKTKLNPLKSMWGKALVSASALVL